MFSSKYGTSDLVEIVVRRWHAYVTNINKWKSIIVQLALYV